MIGGGIVGYNAAVIALGLGAQVTILERSVDRMRDLEKALHGRVSLLMSSSLQIEELARGRRHRDRRRPDSRRARAEACDPRDDRRDEGRAPSSSTSRSTRAAASRPHTPTTHDDPVYEVDGVIHYCVANMPGAVPITSTKALTNVTLPYVEAIAEHGLAAAVAADRGAREGRERRSRGRSRTRQWPRRTTSTTRRSTSPERVGALASWLGRLRGGVCLELLGALGGAQLHDDPRHAGRERDDRDDVEDQPTRLRTVSMRD